MAATPTVPLPLRVELMPVKRGRVPSAPLGIKIEEDVVPAVCDQPVTQLDGPVIISARMAYENAGHGTAPLNNNNLRPAAERAEPRSSHSVRAGGRMPPGLAIGKRIL
jgi:hypothetical protein